MKPLVKVQKIREEGLEALLGEKVTFWCLNYIYNGTLVAVKEGDVILNDASIVYETGAFDEPSFRDSQKLAKEWRLRISAIESYGILNKE